MIEKTKFKSEGEKWSWLAGLIEGEGCLGLYCRTNHRLIFWTKKLAVTNTSKELIDFLVNAFGGKCYSHKETGSNLVSSPDCLPTYQWIIADRKLKPILQEIQPYLVSKEELNKLLLESYSLKHSDPLLYKLAWRIRELKNSFGKGRKRKSKYYY